MGNDCLDSAEEKRRLEEYAKVYFDEISYGIEQKVHILTAEYILSHIKPDILELGCGNGTWTRMILEKHSHVDVVDASPLLLDSIKKEHGPRVDCYHSLFEDFEPATSYETVLLTGTLHHVADPVLILSRVKTWMKASGRLLVVVPNALSLHRRLGKTMHLITDLTEISQLGYQQGHRRVYTPDALRSDIRSAGLTLESEQGLFLKPFSNNLLENLPDNIVKGLFDLSLEMPAEYGTLLFFVCSKSDSGRRA